jgi:hypothetical protein
MPPTTKITGRGAAVTALTPALGRFRIRQRTIRGKKPQPIVMSASPPKATGLHIAWLPMIVQTSGHSAAQAAVRSQWCNLYCHFDPITSKTRSSHR